jgi:hypothetical protein
MAFNSLSRPTPPPPLYINLQLHLDLCGGGYYAGECREGHRRQRRRHHGYLTEVRHVIINII